MDEYSKSSEYDNRKLLKDINSKINKKNDLNDNNNNYNNEDIYSNNIDNDNTIEKSINNKNLEKEKKELIELDSKFQFNINKSRIKENKRYSIPKEDTGRIDSEMEKDVFEIPSKLSDNLLTEKNKVKSSLISNEIEIDDENMNDINLNNNDFPIIKNPFDNINNKNNNHSINNLVSDKKNFSHSLNEISKKKGGFENNGLKSSFIKRSALQSQNINKNVFLNSFYSSKLNYCSNIQNSQNQNNSEISFKDINLKFDIIENVDDNTKKIQNNLHNIIESDEENEDEETLRKLNLNDIIIFVKKFNDGNYNLKIQKNNYEIGKKICEIINNNPFQNISFKVLSNSQHFINFYKMSIEQSIEKLGNEFYDNIESMIEFDKIIKKYNQNEFKNYYTLCISEVYPIVMQELKAYRNVLCDDGNGFLRAFIFNLFEIFIINKNIRELRKITYEISNKISIEFKYNNIVVEKNELIIIMKLIIFHLENSKIKDALLVFTNAFIYHSSFEFGLIKYFKIVLGDFIINNKDYFNISNLKELIPSKYIEQNIFNYNLYITERVMIMDYEVDYFIFFILPTLFNINLKFFLDNNSICLDCNLPNQTYGTIKIIYDFAYYKIGYDSTFMYNNSNFIPYISNEKKEKCNIILINNNLNEKCNICNEIPKEYVKIHKLYEKICKKCLIKYLNDAFIKRLNYFIEDNYLHEEYYCSDIQFTNSLEFNLFISNEDIKKLFNVTNGIPSIIRTNIKNSIICNLCYEQFNQKIAFTLNCGCIFCKECIQQLFLEKTNGKIIYNEYEKKNENINLICPKCNSIIINYDNLIEKLYDIDKFISEAEDRLKIQVRMECCVCKSRDIYFTFDLLINQINLTHALCKNCKNILDEKLKNDRKKSCQTQFNCIFCNYEHVYNMIHFNKENNFYKKDKKNKCCTIF